MEVKGGEEGCWAAAGSGSGSGLPSREHHPKGGQNGYRAGTRGSSGEEGEEAWG